MTTYRLTRNMLDRVLGGVCGGIGSYLSLSSWWVRAAFIALALTSFNFPVLLYILMWLVMPGQSLADLPPLLRPGEPRTPRYARPETVLALGAFEGDFRLSPEQIVRPRLLTAPYHVK